MTAVPVNPEALVSVPSEIEAAFIVNTLAEHGIRASAVGGYTSGFKAEAPGQVTVLVSAADLDRARQLLEETRRDRSEIDWSKIDVGEAE